MIKNAKRLALAGAVLAGVASLIPMSTYAATSGTKTPTVTVTVAPYLTLDSATGVSLSDVTSGTIYDTGQISAKVTANTTYNIKLKATEPRMCPKTDAGTIDTAACATQNIPAGTPAANTNAWGVKINGQSTYTALTASDVTAFTSTGGATGVTTNFPVGISIAPSLPAGTYETTVTVTASTV